MGSDKGGNWSIRDSYYGNEKKERKPIQAFIHEVDKYKEYNLLDIMLKLEGIIVGRSSHAAATVLFGENYNETNAMMKTSKGQYTTQFEMRNTEQSSSVKMDLLVIEALDCMRTCINMMIEDGVMEWKGSLKETFNYYLHPNKLEMTAKDMISFLYTEKNMNYFQMETLVGSQALTKVKPQNFDEVCAVNCLMRLSVDDGEQPIDKYVRFRASNCEEWYQEMRDIGLNEEEINILKEHLCIDYGLCLSQESLMKLTMDKRISNFDLIQSNIARKSIAKKSGEALEKFKKMFFEQGLENGCRQIFLDYIWKYCFSIQFGYSFSIPHVKSYTLILWQELNLCYRFTNGKSYWKAACLTVDSGITETDKKGTIDYGKIAESVGNMRDEILAPNINKSKVGFSVDSEGKILYGLVAINGVNEEDSNKIIANRPYTSFSDFRERCPISNKAIISLIKAGAFDSIEPNRRKIAMEYVKSTTPVLKSLTTVQADSIVTNGLLPKELDKFVKFNGIRKDILQNKNMYEQINKTNAWYILSENNLTILKHLGFTVEYDFNDNGDMIIQKSKLQNTFKKQTIPLTDFLKSENALKAYNTMLLNKEWNKKFKGDFLEWEMESIRSYLGTEHGLDKYDLSYLPICDFDSLEEGEKIDEFKYGLSLIAGTIISSDKDKHTISILPLKGGVVRCKLSKQLFSQYNYVNSIQNGKSKTIIEDSWFTSGTLIVAQGFKQGQVFYIKGYKSSPYPAITKILGKNIEGKTVYKFGRE